MADREPATRHAAGPTSDEVEQYLRDHPDFLIDHPDLVHHLLPPDTQRGDGVVDMQRFMLQRVRGDLNKLQSQQNEILATSRSNLTSQGRIHAAVLRMLEARTLEELIEIVTTDIPAQLDVDTAALAFEALDRLPPGGNRSSLKIVARGVIDRMMGSGKDIMLLPRWLPIRRSSAVPPASSARRRCCACSSSATRRWACWPSAHVLSASSTPARGRSSSASSPRPSS